MVASSRIATARPTPSCLIDTTERVAKVAITATIRAAALVMTLAEWVIPRLIASRVPSPRSNLRECGSG
jgi:hypothetical protein